MRVERCVDCENAVPVVHVPGTASLDAFVEHTITETRDEMAGAWGEIKRTVAWTCPGSGKQF